jgi:hypothetical protein
MLNPLHLNRETKSLFHLTALYIFHTFPRNPARNCFIYLDFYRFLIDNDIPDQITDEAWKII